MLLGIAVAVFGAALSILGGFFSLCGFIVCLVGLTMAKYAHDRQKVVKSTVEKHEPAVPESLDAKE